MKLTGPNKPLIVFAICLLWLVSLLFIGISLVLFLGIGDILLLTGTEYVNSLVLLSGIMMFPTNMYLLWCVAHGRKIDHSLKMVCCPLWLCIVCIVLVNFTGAILAILRIRKCATVVKKSILLCMKYYRNVPKYKTAIDNLQWSLKCCGLNSYKDWFRYEWYDKTRDYDWDPSTKIVHRVRKIVADSVPLSCCKTGSCISNFLSELGTRSINMNGCDAVLRHVIQICMYGHLVIFTIVIVAEVYLLHEMVLSKRESRKCPNARADVVQRLMSVNNNFKPSSSSNQFNPEDSDSAN